MRKCTIQSLEQRENQLAEKVLTIWDDMMLAGSFYLGDRLGLYRAHIITHKY